jgi:membrane protein implicated in regulation of membrane protease activity
LVESAPVPGRVNVDVSLAMRNTPCVLYVYLFATIVGAVMLAASLFGGHHGGIEHDAGGDAGGADTHGAEQNAESIALRIFSVRVWTYLLAFGGATGMLLRTVARMNEPLTALLSLTVGAVAGGLAQTVIRRATQTGESGTVTRVDLVGKTGGVVVPFARGQTGKVRVRVKGADVDILAVTEDDPGLGARDEVLVVEMREGSALVTRSPVKTTPTPPSER